MTRLKFATRTAAAVSLMVGGLLLNTALAPAQTVTTDQMTCSQAIATYEKTGRLHIRTRSGKVLALYSGVPISKKTSIRCGRSSSPTGYHVKTKDKKRCAAFVTCS